jgi:hypothetical protein
MDPNMPRWKQGRSQLAAFVWFGGCSAPALFGFTAQADENLFGYMNGAEPLPRGAPLLLGAMTLHRLDDNARCNVQDFAAQFEYGFTERIAGTLSLQSLGRDGCRAVHDKQSLTPSALGISTRYSVLSPARHAYGLALLTTVSYAWHSSVPDGADAVTVEERLALQRYLLDGQLILLANLSFSFESADAQTMTGLLGSGATYRFAPNWFAGAEMFYIHADGDENKRVLYGGPTLHYGAARWWSTLTWVADLYSSASNSEGVALSPSNQIRFKVGWNF